jgi:hypothetical protein
MRRIKNGSHKGYVEIQEVIKLPNGAVIFPSLDRRTYTIASLTMRCPFVGEMITLDDMHFDSGLLSVVGSGEFSLEGAKQVFLEMLAAVAQYKAEKVLFDGRKLKGRPQELERFLYGEFAAKETTRLIQEHRIAPRFAYVINAPLRDPRRFGETVAINRGMNVRTFESVKDAFEWLELPSPDELDPKPGKDG